jgi:dTDP-4-dehydrorhamnose reductase
MHKVLILGANGMLGSAMYNEFRSSKALITYGLVRRKIRIYNKDPHVIIKDFDSSSVLEGIFFNLRPTVVINCTGITHHSPEGENELRVMKINSYFPNDVHALCLKYHCKFIQISTDCIFSGLRGEYAETDKPDPTDVYGRSKLSGETDPQNSLVLRTSIIGREIETKRNLLEWFLSQKECFGYDKAYFSGLTTNEFAKVIKNKILPKLHLTGIYHVGANRISKYDLLCLIKSKLKVDIQIKRLSELTIDRSLNSKKFQRDFSYTPPTWSDMIKNLSIS